MALAVAAIGALGVRYWNAAAVARADGKMTTAIAQQGEFLVTVRVRGSLAPRRSVELNSPDVTGLQITWLAPRGTVVQANSPVARFDSSTSRQQLDAKTAAVRQAQAALDEAKANARIAQQQDALDLATDENAVKSAQLDAAKAVVLSVIDGAESQLTLGTARETLKVEQATILAHQTSNSAKIASAQRLREKAQADLDLVQQQLREMVLTTPVTGVVNYLTNYSQGFTNAQPFKVGDNVWPNGTIAEIPDLSTLELLAKVSEVDRGRVALGDTVRAHMDALPELTITGKIDAMSDLAEADFGSTFPPPMIFRLHVELQHVDPRLRPDMNGSVDIVTRRIANAISVPTAAIFTVAGKPVVYIAGPGGRFTAAPITVLARNPDNAAVQGVAAGAHVALQPLGGQ